MDIIELWINPPHAITAVILSVAGALGAVMMVYGILLEKEKNQDAVFAIGSFLLLLYALIAHNIVFTIAFAALFLGSGIEWYQIETGQHRHIKRK